MNTVENLQDRLRVDARYAKSLASVQSESDFLDLLHQEGYNLSVDDLTAEIELTEPELEIVQGGSLIGTIIIWIILTGVVTAGMGTATGIGIWGLTKKKK